MHYTVYISKLRTGVKVIKSWQNDLVVIETNSKNRSVPLRV